MDRMFRGSAFAAFLPVLFASIVAALCLMAGAGQSAYADDYRGQDGVYQIQVQIVHASQPDQVSMAQAAFDNVLEPGTAKKVTDQYNKDYAANSKQGETTTPPSYTLTMVVKDGKTYLEARMVPIDRKLGSSSFTGYMGFLDYFPDYHEATSPINENSMAALTESYYTGSEDSKGDNKNLKKGYDGYNEPRKGTDAALRGMRYSKNISMQLTDTSNSELWIRVYVPVMESINQGSGTQYAKVELNYNSMTRVTDDGQVKTAESIADHHASATAGGYQYLANTITTASKQLLQADTYTKASLKNLRTARNKAQSVYAKRKADSFEVMGAIVDLSLAQRNLTKKSSSNGKSGSKSNGSNGASGGKKSSGNSKSDKISNSGKSSGGKSGSSNKSVKLNFAKLKNGTYTLYGEMIKTDRQQQSMSNKAINHNIRIKVKNGKYTVQMTFSKLHYSGKVGALGKLWYFKSGYQHPNGTLSGGTVQAKVLSYLTGSNGGRFKDEYGTNYPKTVSFPLISEAKSDGWVPLQVFVPVMEDISAGTGTQGVYLKLHTDSVVSGKKKVAGSSTGTSTDSVATGGDSSTGSDDGDSVGMLPSGDNSGSDSGAAGLVKPTAGSTDGGSGSAGGSNGAADGNGAVSGSGAATATGADGSDTVTGTGGDSTSGQNGVSSANVQSNVESTSEPEPPLKRYVGLVGGGIATAVFAGLAYALIRRRAQIAALIGAAHR